MRYSNKSLVFVVLLLCQLRGLVDSLRFPVKFSLSLHERSKRNEILRLSDITENQDTPVSTFLQKLKSTNFTAIHENIEPIYEKIKSFQPYLQSLKFDWWTPEKWDIPNKLTLARTVAIPLFITSFLMKKRATTFAIYVLSAVTDFFDGYLARKWNITSDFGAFLDPIADKLMVTSALVLLTVSYPTVFFILPVALIVGRELAISGLREWMSGKGLRQSVKVSYLGKVKTTMQMIATSLLLLVFPGSSTDIDLCVLLGLPKPTVFVAGLLTLYIATIATVLSGVDYFISAWSTVYPSSSISYENSARI